MTVTIHSSHGSFDVNAHTGVPESDLPAEYKHVDHFDLREWREWMKANKLEDGGEEDILLVGFWYRKEGVGQLYSPAEKEARAHALENA